MDDKIFNDFITNLKDITQEQFKMLVKAYAVIGKPKYNLLSSITEQKLAESGINECCPYCDSSIKAHYGTTKSGYQKFRCGNCGKTFTRFSETLLEKSRFSWDIWVEVLQMVLNDDSIDRIKTVLEENFDCKGINIKTVFAMRMKLIYAMANITPPKLSGVIQMDESFVRESQKGKRELVSYIKGEIRKPRYGRHPSKYGTMGPEFATILTAVDTQGYCVCKVIGLGKAPVDSVIDLYENYCIDASFICSDANPIYTATCDLMEIQHYLRPSTYSNILESAGYIYHNDTKTDDEIKAHNNRVLETLYKQRMIDRIENRENLSFKEFNTLKYTHHLNLGKVNQLHSELKLMIEKKMTNVSSKYLPMYMDFFAFRKNWRVQHGRNPANRHDAEEILKQLVMQKTNSTIKQITTTKMPISKISGRAMQILKEKTEIARQHTQNKFFKFDAEQVPNFNSRMILLYAPKKKLRDIAKEHKIKGYSTRSQTELIGDIVRLPDIQTILIDLLTSDRKYEIAQEDIDYLNSLRFTNKDK